MRTSKRERPRKVLEDVGSQPISVKVVLDAPSVEEVRLALNKRESKTQLSVTIAELFRLSTASLTRAGDVRLGGVSKIVELKLYRVEQLVLNADGGYTFLGVIHSSSEWEANYNAGWETYDVWQLCRFSVPGNKDRLATYEVISSEELSYDPWLSKGV